MRFHIGQLVMCLRAPTPSSFNEAIPKIGHVYTVRGYGRGFDDSEAGIFLCEIQNEPQNYLQGFQEVDFRIGNFRPLDDSRLQIFREMLVSPRKRVAA